MPSYQRRFLGYVMRIIVNGECTEHPDGINVAELLASLGLEPLRVAVELNGELIPRSRHRATTIAGNDRLEIVTLVGGG